MRFSLLFPWDILHLNKSIRENVSTHLRITRVEFTFSIYSCIGLPIFFSNIRKKLYAKYSVVDTRPLPEKEDIKEGYLHRGLLVKNLGND